MGDRNQLQSVGAGSGLRLLTSALSVHKVDQIVRQREQWARDAIRDFGRGEALKALLAFAERGGIVEAQGAKATVKSLVNAWFETKAARPKETTLLIAKTNAQVRAISAEVRARLRNAGTIIGDDVNLRAVTPSGHAVEIAVAKGDRIRLLARAKLSGVDVINGTEVTVEAIRRETNGHAEILSRTDNTHIRFSTQDIADDKGLVRIAHAYATTIHGCQGLTVDRSFCCLTPEMNRHDIYVAASRAREETRFFVDARAIDLRIAAERPLEQRSKALEINAEDRRDYMARQVARSGLKQTTLDVLMAAQERQGRDLRAEQEDRRETTVQPPKRSRELTLE